MVSSLGKRQELVCVCVCVCVCVTVQKTDKKKTPSVLTQEVKEKQAGVEEGVCVGRKGGNFLFSIKYTPVFFHCLYNQSINKQINPIKLARTDEQTKKSLKASLQNKQKSLDL